jgi:hypothetical protein
LVAVTGKHRSTIKREPNNKISRNTPSRRAPCVLRNAVHATTNRSPRIGQGLNVKQSVEPGQFGRSN